MEEPAKPVCGPPRRDYRAATPTRLPSAAGLNTLIAWHTRWPHAGAKALAPRQRPSRRQTARHWNGGSMERKRSRARLLPPETGRPPLVRGARF